jgi:hypothetical protein
MVNLFAQGHQEESGRLIGGSEVPNGRAGVLEKRVVDHINVFVVEVEQSRERRNDVLRERSLEHGDEVAEHTVDGVLILRLDAELAA